MSDSVTAARYHARDGTEHRVLVERSPEVGWRVLDAVGDDAIVVDTLAGQDDRLDQAAALARDYAAEQQAHHDGEWLDDPLPKHQPEASEERSCAAPDRTRRPHDTGCRGRPTAAEPQSDSQARYADPAPAARAPAPPLRPGGSPGRRGRRGAAALPRAAAPTAASSPSVAGCRC